MFRVMLLMPLASRPILALFIQLWPTDTGLSNDREDLGGVLGVGASDEGQTLGFELGLEEAVCLLELELVVKAMRVDGRRAGVLESFFAHFFIIIFHFRLK